MLIEIKNVDELVIYSSSKHDNIKDVVEEAVANNVSLCLANLEGVDLSNANLQYARLGSANLKNANLERADLGNANLELVDLERSDMYGADLSYANLHGSCLEGSDLRDANLMYTDLRWANLKMIDLSAANLTYANLMGANLEGANLTEVELAGAHVDRLSGINYAVCSFRGHGERGRQLFAIEINSEVILFCGCFKGNEKQLRDYIKEGPVAFKESRLIALETVLKLISIEKKY